MLHPPSPTPNGVGLRGSSGCRSATSATCFHGGNMIKNNYSGSVYLNNYFLFPIITPQLTWQLWRCGREIGRFAIFEFAKHPKT